MYKAETDVYVYVYIYKSEYKCLWSKEIIVKVFLVLPPLNSLWISVLFPWHIFHFVKYVSVRGVSVAVNEIFVYVDKHLSNRWICASAMARIPQFTDFIPAYI